jgi:hypothetical protein
MKLADRATTPEVRMLAHTLEQLCYLTRTHVFEAFQDATEREVSTTLDAVVTEIKQAQETLARLERHVQSELMQHGTLAPKMPKVRNKSA